MKINLTSPKIPFVKHQVVIPAKAGIQGQSSYEPWMPDRVRHDEKGLKAEFIVIFLLKVVVRPFGWVATV
jgi:hypothetical protein